MAATRLPLTGHSLAEAVDFARPGMPSQDTVYQVVSFTPPAGETSYKRIRTTEFDSYDPASERASVASLVGRTPPTSPDEFAAAVAEATGPVTDDYTGTSRKAAKLSIAEGTTESFTDLLQLISSLPADEAMISHDPPISITADSGRVAEEQRNVRLTGYLYAASRERDNDFHLMVGRDPRASPETYMTVEVSGLPSRSDKSHAALKTARDSFQAFFGKHLPQLTYDYYDPPIPLVITGSLFFDMDHATGPHPGPPSLKSHIPTIWEIHPVTAITLGTQRGSSERSGLPAENTIREVVDFESPQGEKFRILRTNEVDSYEEAIGQEESNKR
ncbi:MAG: hypothetical protein E6I52_19260 [Chloroflexi bacterium]|nr:MAG: hypothetical protein E6I52_19260 [Chloroflexota bacterium]